MAFPTWGFPAYMFCLPLFSPFDIPVYFIIEFIACCSFVTGQAQVIDRRVSRVTALQAPSQHGFVVVDLCDLWTFA
jgi:hypothetical protein